MYEWIIRDWIEAKRRKHKVEPLVPLEKGEKKQPCLRGLKCPDFDRFCETCDDTA